MSAGLVLASAAMPMPPIISSIGPDCMGLDSLVMAGGIPASAAYPGAKLTYYYPLTLRTPTTIQRVWWMNGATVGTDNIEVGLFTRASGLPASRIVSNGAATLSAGASIVQSVAVTVTTVPAGLYFLAISGSGTTATIYREGAGLTVAHEKSLGVCQETTGSFGLPSTATPIAVSFFYLPVFGLATVTTI